MNVCQEKQLPLQKSSSLLLIYTKILVKLLLISLICVFSLKVIYLNSYKIMSIIPKLKFQKTLALELAQSISIIYIVYFSIEE